MRSVSPTCPHNGTKAASGGRRCNWINPHNMPHDNHQHDPNAVKVSARRALIHVVTHHHGSPYTLEPDHSRRGFSGHRTTLVSARCRAVVEQAPDACP